MIHILLENCNPFESFDRDTFQPVIVRVDGHSGFGKKGGDVVCAGISAIVQTAVIAVTRVAGLRQDVIQRDGYLESKIGVPVSTLERDALRIILHTMVIGVEEIEKAYPGSVKIELK